MSSFSPQQLLQALRQPPACQRFIIAYSGGMDSHVLLHAVAAIRASLGKPVMAVHINHGLSPQSGQWLRHCRNTCRDLAVTLETFDVDARPQRGQSPEAAARDARYEAFRALMQAGDCLLTAHHQNDQAETLLLQLLRGCGPHGLAAMADCSRFAAGYLRRPLLSYERPALAAYARRHALNWIDDDSNFDTGYNRNYLRHEVLPVLARRWPAWSRTVSRSARLNADTALLLDQLAAQDLDRVQGRFPGTVAIAALTQLDPVRQKNVLHYWIRSLSLPLPHHEHIRQLLDEMLPAARDRQPLVRWPGCEVRRHDDHLFAMSPLEPVDSRQVIEWDMKQALELPDHNGVLSLQRCHHGGIDGQFFHDAVVTVRYRRGGEFCRPGVDRHRRPLKKILNELAVLPWLRDRLPLLYIDDQLAAIGQYLVCAPFETPPGQAGTRLHWQHHAMPQPLADSETWRGGD